MKTMQMYDYKCFMKNPISEPCIVNASMSDLRQKSLLEVLSFKQQYPNAMILLDLKITGDDLLNAKLAYDAGADLVSCMGFCSDRTMMDVLLIAEENQGQVIMDMSGCADIEDRMTDAAIYGADYAIVPEGQNYDSDTELTVCYYRQRISAYLYSGSESIAKEASI